MKAKTTTSKKATTTTSTATAPAEATLANDTSITLAEPATKPPASARAASDAASKRKAPKKPTEPSAAQEGSQEPLGTTATTKMKQGVKKPAKAPRTATTEPVEAETVAEPSAPAKAPKPTKKTAPSSMPRAKPGAPATAEKPWLATVSDATLADAATGFLAALKAEGASESTVSGYRRELKVALDHFGERKLLALIQPHEVAAYNESDAVMVARNGEPKAAPSYLRTRRVLRLALCWAVEKGMLESAPLPVAG